MDPMELIREGKIHRFFRATRKLNAAEIVSHVTQRAAGREPAFLEENDYLSMLGILKDVTEKYRLQLFAFCLMPNHVHLLFATSEANLWDAMRDLFSRYARSFNRKYERKGHLFGGPYRQAVCLEESYLIAASLYIHLNPTRSKQMEDPLDYPWSSCRLYCDEKAVESFVQPDLILGLLGKSRVQATKKFIELLRKGAELELGLVPEQVDAIEEFRAKILSFLPLRLRTGQSRRRSPGQGESVGLDPETLERQIEEVRRGDLVNTAETRRAKKYMIEELLARGYTKEKISEKLGVSRKTVYNLMKSPL